MTGILASSLLWKVIKATHYAYPILILLYFVVASLAGICLSTAPSLRVRDQYVRRDIILWLILVAALGYVVQAFLLGLRSFTREGWVASQDVVVYSISSSIIWAIQGLALKDSEFPIWYPYYVNWTIAILFELLLLILAAAFCAPKDLFDFAAIAIQGLRVCNFVILLSIYIWLRNRRGSYDASDTERQPLLKDGLVTDQLGTGLPTQATAEYGATAAGSSKKPNIQDDLDTDDYLKNKRKDEERVAKRLKQDGNWWTYAKGFAIFFPLIWPVHSKSLQTRAVLVAFCLFSMNFMNVLVPRQLGAITDALVSGNGRRSLTEVALYAGLIFAKSNACVGWLQEWLWQPVEFYAYSALNTAAQSHVMSLSSDFHASKEANDIFMDVYRGKNIIPLVDTVCFKVIPMFIDLALVFAYLYYLFGPYMALNLGVTTLVYLYATSRVAAMIDDRRRGYLAHHRREWRAQQSTIGKWQLASYFNNIPYEEEFYSSMVKNHVDSQKGLRLFSNIGAALRGLVMTVGLFGACLLAVYQVIHKSRSPGDFVVLLSYWQQLQVPLSFFSNMYRSISENMMDAERLLELFRTKPSIVDDKDAKPLKFVKGEVSFNNVSFTYDGRKTSLKGVDFVVTGGSTIGIVGETGGGKSTILRLLDRFYDATDGSIEIDGQDIRKITLKSLRESIGVVAQDTMLFNDTIMNNVRYARRDASDTEVYEACKSAAIHDKIITFPDGYNSKVGANGLKLSGGEKQRIAIARAFLKNPRIVLLDEATSAVDTETEELIQEAFRKLCTGRTTFTVAHRLSTIMRADRILVIKDGQIVEDGLHGELICKKGKYYDMWSKQIFSILDADKSKSGGASFQQTNDGIRTELEPHDNKSNLGKNKKTIENRHANCYLKGKGLTAESLPRLKPEVPEFVPRDHRIDSSGPTQSTQSELKLDPKEKHRREKEEKKREKEQKKAGLGLVSKAAKTVDTVTATLKGLQEPKNDSQRSASTSGLEDTREVSETEQRIEKPRFRRPRFSNRRHESKSQPANRNMDGVGDSEEMSMGISGNSQTFLEEDPTQNRRVSAPDYLTSLNSQDLENFSRRGRSRRPRHWRMKNRAAEQTESATVSSDFASQDPSADDMTPLNVPSTSPPIARDASGS